MAAKLYDVIVVGGGISGLTAARNLAKKGRRVLVLEARDRLGGRIHTYKSDNEKHSADQGASWIHGTHGNPLTDIAKALKLDLHVAEAPFTSARDHKGHDLDPALKAQLGMNVIGTLFYGSRQAAQYGPQVPAQSTSLANFVYAEDSLLYAGLDEFPNGSFYAESMGRIFDGWTGAGLEQVSFKWWGSEQDFHGPDGYVSAGYSSMITWMEQEIVESGGHIQLQQEVTAIEVPEDEEAPDAMVIVTTKSNDGAPSKQFTSKLSLVTLPLGVLKAHPPKFTPPLPARRLEAISNLGFGLLDKVTLLYDKPWWPLDEPGFILMPDPAAASQGPLLGEYAHPRAMTILNLWPRTKTPVLQIFLGGEAGEQIEARSDEEVRKWAHSTVARYFKRDLPDSIPAPIDTLVTRWRHDPYSKGSYTFIPRSDDKMSDQSDDPAPGYSTAGGTPLDLLELSHPLWDRLFWAGEHTSIDHYASVHGAYMTGLEQSEKMGVILAAADDSGA